jgi:hypothetical protein
VDLPLSVYQQSGSDWQPSEDHHVGHECLLAAILLAFPYVGRLNGIEVGAMLPASLL